MHWDLATGGHGGLDRPGGVAGGAGRSSRAAALADVRQRRALSLICFQITRVLHARQRGGHQGGGSSMHGPVEWPSTASFTRRACMPPGFLTSHLHPGPPPCPAPGSCQRGWQSPQRSVPGLLRAIGGQPRSVGRPASFSALTPCSIPTKRSIPHGRIYVSNLAQLTAREWHPAASACVALARKRCCTHRQRSVHAYQLRCSSVHPAEIGWPGPDEASLLGSWMIEWENL